MPGSTFGTIFRLTTFGESHGAAIGGIVDGCPAGLLINTDAIQRDLDRRRPGQSSLTTPRNEADRIQMLSGIFEGHTTGTPIAFLIANSDQRSGDYATLKDVFRPSHADYTWEAKYGTRDHRGGGRASARETAARVAAGGIAKQYLAKAGIRIQAWVSAIGTVRIEKEWHQLDFSLPENDLRCPDPMAAGRMRSLIEEVRSEGDTIGGIVECVVTGVPPGLGEPVFDKIHADLGKAMLSINAVKGFETGSGFAAATMRGSQHNDAFIPEGGSVATRTNYSGGIQGGISNGMPITMRIAFKPVASIARTQDTLTRDGQATTLEVQGRHDPCVVPRAVPIVEAMAALVLADHHLRQRTSTL